MLLDLFKQYVPWLVVMVIAFFVWLAVKNHQRAHSIRYSGRISEIIDRRRNVVIFTIISVMLMLGLVIFLLS